MRKCQYLRNLMKVFVLFFPVFSFAEESFLDLVPLEDSTDLSLPKKMGYLLIYVDVEGVAPSITYRKKGSPEVIEGRVVSLKGLPEGFFLMQLKKGRYEITKVNVPLYNLPYWVDTANDELWSFDVEPNKINYFGELVVESERRRESVSVNRHNRFSKNYHDVLHRYSSFIDRYPLRLAFSYQDDFLGQLFE